MQRLDMIFFCMARRLRVGTPNAVVKESVRGHRRRIIKIAAIDNDRIRQHGAKPLEIEIRRSQTSQ